MTTLAVHCFYHPQPFGSTAPIFGCDMGLLPAPQQWFFYLLAGLCLALGLLLIAMGRNPLPFGRKSSSPLSARLDGAGFVVLSMVLIALNVSGPEPDAQRARDLQNTLVPLVGALLYVALMAAGWYVDRRDRRGRSTA